MRWPASARVGWWAALALLLCGVLHVSQYWSPSSYGMVLRITGQEGEGLVLGTPRAIRSDEWAVVTPLTRAALNNGFQRTNDTSPYREDMRINYGLPLADWGLAFKPTLWPFFWADAARAYSFHWYATLALFLAGHAFLFARLGLAPLPAMLLSASLYFAPFTQFWWSEKGPVFAFFPWVVGVLLTQWRLSVRLALFYWLGASWLITNFYPPLFVPLAFVGAVLLLAFGREWFQPRRLAALALTSVAAGATAALYLKDYLKNSASTIYPGQRTGGGGEVPAIEWWAQLFPFATFDSEYQSLLNGQNICEAGAMGAALVLAVLCLLRYRQAAQSLQAGHLLRAPALTMVAGLLLMYAWMLLPLPAWAGMPLLWNHVQPERMEYPAGLLLAFLCVWLAEKAGLVLSWRRLVAYALAVLGGWLVFKGASLHAAPDAGRVWMLGNDLIVLPALAVGLLAARLLRLRLQTAVLAASAASGAIVLFGFNPIQSAQPIFAPMPPEFKRSLEMERVGGTGPVAVMGWPGAVLNGFGFPSITHVTAVPALAYWRSRYPHMPGDEFMAVFNRYSHVLLDDRATQPFTPQPDVVRIPLRDYWSSQRFWLPEQVDQPLHPQWLNPGAVAAGDVRLPHGGRLSEFRVFIGTGVGRADGDLHLRLCQAQRCASAHAPLQGARDNAFIRLVFDEPLRVEAHEPLRYEIGPRGGQHAVALWRYASVGTVHASLSEATEASPTSPRLVLGFAP